jgi:hypothetical protein
MSICKVAFAAVIVSICFIYLSDVARANGVMTQAQVQTPLPPPPPVPGAPPMPSRSSSGVQVPAVLVENRGNKAIVVLLAHRKDGNQIICSKDTIPPARVVRFKACDTEMYFIMHDGRQVRNFNITGNFYAIYWNEDNKVWSLKLVSDRE